MTKNSFPGGIKFKGAGLTELLEGYSEYYELSDAATDRIKRLLDFLEDSEHAPTTIRSGVAAFETHIADSLVALDLIEREADLVGADLGSGAGFPGAVLAAAIPTLRVSLVESVGRKCNFIEAMLSYAGIEGAVAVNSRAESWLSGFNQCDFITARALAKLGVIAEYAAPLLKPGGRLIAWKGARDDDEEVQAEKAFDILGLQMVEIRPVKPFPNVQNRHLYVAKKVRETPDRFPRRPGMALKKPLGL